MFLIAHLSQWPPSGCQIMLTILCHIAVSMKESTAAAQVGFPKDLVQIINGPRQGSQNTQVNTITELGAQIRSL